MSPKIESTPAATLVCSKKLGLVWGGKALPPQTKPSFFEQTKVAAGVDSIFGDILDADYLTEVVKKKQPEVIFHLAAQPLVRYAYQHPKETYLVNVIGTVNLLEAI